MDSIKTRANECVDNSTDSIKAVKDAIAMVTTAHSTILEHTDMFTESTLLYPPTVMAGEKTSIESLKSADTGFKFKASISVECSPETSRRLKDIETALSSLQDTKQKTEDDISEIKKWRDNFVTEQKDIRIKIEKLCKKHKQHFKSIRTQIHEQEKKLKNLSEEMESLREKESIFVKIIERMSIDMKDYKRNLDKINKEMPGRTDKTRHLSQEIKSHSDLIATIQEDGKKNRRYTTKTCEKLLSKTETQEKDVLKLSQNSPAIANQQVKHSTLGFVASQGRWNGEWYMGHPVITFKTVKRNVGNHFDPKTGEFTAPVDGLYKASPTIKQTADDEVKVCVGHRSGGVTSWLDCVVTEDKSVDASRTLEVQMKTGDVLYSVTGHNDCECTHFSCALLDV
ncbi:uncharacterized protein LOC131947465 [Physella acuta]|uniref:uncharacterized protein LOC131947465 n=1 Tax=Physella acuta TaxID=109671 RepID=UPI0027DBB757|nr:uncharacterized protein LOC131947465 [Physella acuta]